MSDPPVKSSTESQSEETEQEASTSGQEGPSNAADQPVAEAQGPAPESGDSGDARQPEEGDESETSERPRVDDSAAPDAPETSTQGLEGSAGEVDPLRHPEHLKTAKVFAEIAVDSGPDGDLDPSMNRSRAALMLLSESLFWVRRSLTESPAPGDMGEWLGSLDEGLLGRVTRDPKLLPGAKRALGRDPRAAEPIDADELEALVRLTRGLIHELEAPARQLERKKALRLTKIAAAFLIGVVVLVAAIWRLVVPPDLALGATMTTSSTLKQCVNPTDCGSAVFHTRLQKNPWVMYDLGAEHDLSLVKVHNRSDCCFERAVPLIVETSLDGKQWTEQARRNEVFLNWSASINARARYVRLRVPRQVYFHLGPVVIR